MTDDTKFMAKTVGVCALVLVLAGWGAWVAIEKDHRDCAAACTKAKAFETPQQCAFFCRWGGDQR